jgi:molybdate transport system substrate-binding protein
MPTRTLIFSSIWIANAFFVLLADAHAADIKVLSDSPLASALRRIAPAFHHDSGHEVQFEFGLSPVIHKRVSDGEAGDVVIIQPTFINDLVNAGKIVAGQHPTIARVGIGLFTRADANIPDVSTVATFKQALLDADTLVFSNVAAGNYFATVLERLGIGGTLQSKITRAIPADVVARIVEGKGKDIGVMVVTLIIADKRLKLIGALPPEYQSYLVYAAAPMVDSQSPEAAKEFIRFLALPQSRQEFVASGAN